LRQVIHLLFIAAATGIILGICFVAALNDRQSERGLRRQKILLDTALQNMSQGLCMFNAEGRIMLFNERYANILEVAAAEITETLLLRNSVAIMAELRTLKDMGVSIVMDDFGTGYSSLSYLWRFPFDKIKIDRSFMLGFDSSGHDAKTVLKTIIALGRELNMRVTVEGVETASRAAFLDEVNGDQAQGFFFGRPVPASEVAADILADFRKAPGARRQPQCEAAK